MIFDEPVIPPPPIVKEFPPEAPRFPKVSWLFSVTGPVYEDAARLDATVILSVPELPAATVMGFATARADAIMSVALLLPLESPSVIMPVPREDALVAWLTVPALIVMPPV